MLSRRHAGPRFVRGLTLLLAALPLTAVPTSAQLALPPLASAAAPLVFRGVTVIDVETGERRPDQAVVVVGTRIQRVAPANAVRVPPGARVVEARGRYLVPGFWDMHSHALLYADVGKVDIAFPLFLANGVTGVREPHTAVPLATVGRWKREVAQGLRMGPRLITAGPQINGYGDSARDRRTQAGRVWVTTRAEARQAVESLKVAGADMLKTYRMSPAMYFAVAAEARRIGLPIAGHGTGPVEGGGMTLSDSGAILLDHGPEFRPCGEFNSIETFDAQRCETAGRRYWRNGTYVVLTPMVNGASDPWRARYWARAQRYIPSTAPAYRWAKKVGATAAAQAAPPPTSTADWARLAGTPDADDVARSPMRFWFHHLPMVVGSHAVDLPGFAFHIVVATTATYGVPPLQLLQAITLNPARALRATDSLGTVASGKLADLVLLDADPLEDIWHAQEVRAVVANGRYYDRAALDRGLAEVEQVVRRIDKSQASPEP